MSTASASDSRDMSAVGENLPSSTTRLDPVARNVVDVTLSLAESIDLVLVDVESDRGEPSLYKGPN